MNFGVAEVVIILFFMLLPAALMIWAIMDLLKRTYLSDINKLIWALVIILIPVIGALVYLVAGRRQASG